MIIKFEDSWKDRINSAEDVQYWLFDGCSKVHYTHLKVERKNLIHQDELTQGDHNFIILNKYEKFCEDPKFDGDYYWYKRLNCTRGDREWVAYSDQPVYICNDNGKTIERI